MLVLILGLVICGNLNVSQPRRQTLLGSRHCGKCDKRTELFLLHNRNIELVQIDIRKKRFVLRTVDITAVFKERFRVQPPPPLKCLYTSFLHLSQVPLYFFYINPQSNKNKKYLYVCIIL